MPSFMLKLIFFLYVNRWILLFKGGGGGEFFLIVVHKTSLIHENMEILQDSNTKKQPNIFIL